MPGIEKEVMMRRSAAVLIGLSAVTALALTGCAKNSPKNTSPTSTVSVSEVNKDQALAALVPAAIKASGKLVVVINVPYAPNEYKDSSGKIIGWEPDFLDAVAKKLGLTAVYQESIFDNIIPSVTGGKYNVGMSSFTDNKTREAKVDFVDYYSAGFQWAAPAGRTVSPDNACGLKVAVQTATTEDTDDVPAKSKACVAAGKKPITKIKIDSQDAVNQAVILGQADAFDADSPITQYAVKQSKGKLQLSGDIYGAAPYGLVIAKDAGSLKDALQKAIQSMIDDGTYGQILSKWGVEAGGIKQATVNGAQS
jgi:polar amino acid transport system substrate-binding protein